jgi:signal transduction histidine kinase
MGEIDAAVSDRARLPFLAGGGEMGERTRAFDWSQTAVGPLANWPHSLRTAVGIVLNSRYPMFLWWGRELTKFYNDGYIPMLGKKHPAALGRPAAAVWSDVWPVVGPQAEAVINEGRATWNEELLLVMERNGFTEEAYFTFSYSPVPDDAGGIGGLFCAVTEDTVRVLGQRRLRTLRALAAQATQARTAEGACEVAARTLAENVHDLPFVLLYLLDDGGRPANLAGRTGLGRGSPASPGAIDLYDPNAAWPFRKVAETGQAVEVHDLWQKFGPLPGGAWPESSQQAVVLPMATPGQTQLAGFIVAGISPRLAYDDYKGFMDLLAGHAAAAVANARAYEEERRRAEALTELDRAKTSFFSNVSHEFRTPLTLMLGPVEELLADRVPDLPTDVKGQLQVVHRNGLRLLRLVNSLLDFSRIEAGRVRAVYEPTDLAAFTTDLASSFRSACERAGLGLVVDGAALSGPVYVDRDMWEKIVLNLLSNAFKFTFEGQIDVTLRPAGNAAELRVRDTGTGIPAQEMSRLFERFHRVENARGRTHEGSGIGLALVQELVHLHGGSITAESVVGQGTTFTVTVPLGSAHLPPDRLGTGRTLASTATGAGPYVEEALRWLPEPEVRGQRSEVRSQKSESGELADSVLTADFRPLTSDRCPLTSGSRPRVLVADDNADMRQYITRLLDARYQVEAVADGQAALAAAREHSPELILTDVLMPRLDGFGLLRELRADPRTSSVPIIMLSARAGEESRVEGMEAGADDYLVKPFSARELLARVSAHLQMARLRREASAALRRQNERLHLLSSAAEVLLHGDDPDGMLRSLFGRIAPHLGLDAFFNYMVDETGETLRLESCAGIPAEMAETITRLRFGEAICGTVALHCQPVVATRIQQSDDPKAQLVKSLGFRAFACNPLLADDQLLGTLSFASRTRDQFDPEELEFLRTICHYVTVAYVRVRLVRQLREADRRKDEFLATLAHELRNPLAPIRTAVQVLRAKGPAEPDLMWGRDVIDRQVQQMARLLDDLLDISRVTRGRLELRKQRVTLAEVVASAVETSRPPVEAGGHELTVTLPAEPVYLEADPIRLAQVFLNLLNNAAKYTEKGGRIRLTAQREGQEVVVSVTDTGIGIAPQHLPHLFDMFSQVTSALERSQGGLGIGLSLVKGLVEMHGGSITARSDGPGKGSEFIVRLPVAISPQVPDQRPAVEPEKLCPAGCRIVVADDNRDAAKSLAMLLRIMGHEVHTAGDGEEALALAAKFRPDVALLDIGMPKRDGYETARSIRQEPWGGAMTLIALTGWGQEEDRRQALEAGFDAHMVKPVDPDMLEKLLGSVTLRKTD